MPTDSPDQAAAPLKTQLLERLHTANARVDDWLKNLTPAQLVAPGPEGWSVKDHLAHLTAWRRKLLAGLQGIPGPQAMNVDPETWAGGDDAINAVIQKRESARPLEDIMAEHRATQAELMAWVEAHSEAELKARYRPNDSRVTDSILDVIPGNSYEHDLDHLPWMQALVRTK